MSQPPPMRDVKGKTAYITASSDGIGLGIARAFSNAGMNVVIGYRNEKRLAWRCRCSPKDAPVFPVKHDVVGHDGWVEAAGSREGQVRQTARGREQCRYQDVRARRRESTAEEWQQSIDVNFGAIYHSVAVILPHMKEHNEGGQFVTTASMSGLLPAVTAGIYTSTKFAAVAIMEALRIELEGTNIGTSAFCPGGVSTDNRRPGSRPPPPPLPDGRQRPAFGPWRDEST